jgi:hypothetical protein
MLGGAVLVAALLSLLQGEVGYTIGAGTEARGARLESSAGGTPVSTDQFQLDVAPQLRLEYRTAALTTSADYQPRFWYDRTSGQVSLVHRATLGLTATPSRTLRLRGSFAGSYGYQDVLTPTVPGTGPVQPLAQVTRLHQEGAEASLAVDLSGLRRFQLSLGVGFVASGGADDAARVLNPLSYGPRATLAATWQASARDLLATDLSYDRRAFVTSRTNPAAVAPAPVWYAVASEVWTHAIGATLSGRLGAGGAIASAGGASPAGEAALTWAHASGWSLRGASRLSPYVDPLSARVYSLLDASLSANGQAASWLGLGLEAAGGIATSGPQRDQTTFRAEVRATLPLGAGLTASPGLRVQVQRPPGHGGSATPGAATGFTLWTASVSLAWSHHGEL